MTRLKVSERREKAREAYYLFVQRVTKTEIAKEIGVSRPSVYKLIEEELAGRAAERSTDSEKEKAISTYEAIIKAAWERFKETDNRSLNSTGFLNTIINAQSHIDALNGLLIKDRASDTGTFAETFLAGANTMRELWAERKAELESSGAGGAGR